MPAPPSAGSTPAMHHVAYRQEPARRPMMAIMNPSHVAALRTPREPAGPRPKKRTPRAANHKRPAATDSGVYLPAGSADDVHHMMRTSISTAGTSLPAITPRRLNRARGQAKDAQALAFDLNLEELRGSSSPAGALFHTSPVVWSGEFSPQEIDSPSSLHTWIDPVSSRPTTTEGKETSRPPSQRPENAREQPSFSGSLGSPELIPVQGIGSVSVRLAADKDECVIDYGSSFIESSPVLGNEGFAHPGHEPNEDPEADWTQQGMQKRLSDYDRMEDEYRTTSAYYVQGAQYYGSKDVQPGAGFSRNLMRFADPRSRVFQYPTPSEALQTMTKRPHERLHAPVSSVAMVGTRPPSIDQTFYTLQQMKRQWLMQYSREEKEATAPRSSPQLAPIKRTRDSEGTDQFLRTPPAGSTRPTRVMSDPRPGSKEQTRKDAKKNEADRKTEPNVSGSVNSPWMSSPVAEVQKAPVLNSSEERPTSGPSHGYSPPITSPRQLREPMCEEDSDTGLIGLFSSTTSPPLSPGRPDAMRQGSAALAMQLSPIGEFSFESSFSSRESPHLQLGLSIQQVETHAMLRLASQDAPPPMLGSQKDGHSSPTTPWADKMQSDAGLFAAGRSPIEAEALPLSPGKAASPSSKETSPKQERHSGMQVLGPGQLAAGFDFFRDAAKKGAPTKVQRASSSSPKRRKTGRESKQWDGPDHRVPGKQAEREQQVLLINSPYQGGTDPLVGQRSDFQRRANEISSNGHKRTLIVQEIQKRHLASDGNRALLRCEEELGKKHLKNAMRDHQLAYQFYAKAEVLHEKSAALQGLHQRILEITREYHDYHKPDILPSTPSAPEAVPLIRVPFRGPDRLQPDGLHAKSREEFEAMRRAAIEEERCRRESLIDEVKRQAELAAKLKLQEEEERAARLEEARVRAEQLEAARQLDAGELQRLEEEEAERLRKEQEEEEERRLEEAAEEARRLDEQRLKQELREARRQVIAEKQKFLQELALAEEKRRAEQVVLRAAFELILKPLLDDIATSLIGDLQEDAQREHEETRREECRKIVEETLQHLLVRVHKEATCRADSARRRTERETEVAVCVEFMVCELESAEEARLLLEEARRRALEAEEAARRKAFEEEAAARREVEKCVDDLINNVEAIIAEEMAAEAQRQKEEAAAREARALAEAARTATLGICTMLMDDAVAEALLELAQEAREEMEEEEAAERKRKEEEERRAEEERLRREEEERLAKLNGAITLEACARRLIFSAQHTKTLLALFAEEERIRLEEERRRREEELRLATQRAAEKLQAASRRKASRSGFVGLVVVVPPLQACCRRWGARSKYVQKADAAVIIQAGARMLLARRVFKRFHRAATMLQGLLRTHPQRAHFMREGRMIRLLQAYPRARMEQRNLAAGLESQLMLSAHVRMQISRQILSGLYQEALLLQAVSRRKLIKTDLQGMRASASVLQTCFRRTFSSAELNRKLAVITLEPFLLSGTALHGWSSCLLAAAKLIDNIRTVACMTGFANMGRAAEFLQRTVRRNVAVAAYHVLVREDRQERKRVQEEEKARQREQDVATKQKQIMEQMEAKNRALREAAEAEAAKEAQRKKMLAEYSHKAAPEEPARKKLEPREVVHAKRDDSETFALAVSYEKEKMYDKAIATLLKIMRVPALRMACLLKRAACLGKLSMRRDCLKDFDAAVREFPNEHLPFYMRALHYVQWKEDELAMRDITHALALVPDHAESLNLQASLKFKYGYFVEATTLATRALEIKKGVAQLYIIRGLSRRELGLMQEARTDLSAAIIMMLDALPRQDAQADEAELKSLFTTLTDAVIVTFCDACLADGQSGAQLAVDVLSRIIAFTGKRGVAFAMRALAFCALERFDNAEEDFETAENVDPDNPHFLMARAQFTRHSDPVSSVSDCERAAEIDPDNIRVHVVQGKIYEENHESQKALTAYKQALEHEEVGSLHYEAAIRAGVLQYKLAESSVDLKQKALALLREAARLHAPRTEPLVTLARFLEAAGSYSSAIRCLSRLIHMNPSDPRAYVLRSQCLLLAGNSSGALRDRQTALLLDSRTDPDVMSGQIEALIESQDLIRALSKVNDSIARHPGHAHFKILYGKVLHLLGDIEGARKKFDEGIGSGNADSTDLESRGEFHLQTGSVPQAVQDFKASIQLDETNTSSYVSLGEARLRTGDSRGAADDLDGALQRQPNNKRALHLRAIVYEKEAKFSNALGIYKKMISILELEILKPTTMRDLLCKAKSHQEHEYYSFEAHMKAGLLCTRMRDYPGAIDHYNQVLKASPKCLQALLHRGIAFHAHGYHESAVSDYNKALAIEPGHSIVLENRAKAFASQKEWKRAISDVEAIRESERDAQVFALLASCYSAIDLKEAALRAIDASLKLDGLSLHALISKADILEALHPLQRPAMSCYSRALHLHTSSQLARLKHALAAAKRGFIDVAIKEIRGARAVADAAGNGNNVHEQTMIEELGAMIMVESSMPVAAGAMVDKLLGGHPGDVALRASLLTARGVLHQQEKDMGTARVDFARAVQVNPSDPEAHYNLGCFRMQEMDWRGAYKSLTKTISIRPKHTLAILNRGVSLYQMHRAAEALRDFNTALAVQPDFAQALLNRGVMHQIAGSYAEAEVDLSRAMVLLGNSRASLESRVNLYQSIGRKDLALRDNAGLIALTDP